MRSDITLDLGLRYEYTPPVAGREGRNDEHLGASGFGTPSSKANPASYGSAAETYATRGGGSDPAICVARDGRLGDRLIASDKTNFAPRIGCGAHRRRRPCEPVTAFSTHRIRPAVFDMSHNIPGASRRRHRVDARAALRRGRNEPLRCSDAAAGVCHGAAGPGQSTRSPNALRRTVPPKLPAGSRPQHGRGGRVLWQPRAPLAAVHHAEPARARHEPSRHCSCSRTRAGELADDQ